MGGSATKPVITRGHIKRSALQLDLAGGINPKVYTHLFVPRKELYQGSWIEERGRQKL
jgi:hypothetical protein